MDLNTIWFLLIAVLFTGFFFLEGFDYGVGILLPWVGQTDRERRMVMNTIGPVWDGNEVWMITAAGALFAAFPDWYATMLSGFYIPMTLLIVALIWRGVSFEFRSKLEAPRWRATWDRALTYGSLVPAMLWGIVFANLVRGLQIDADLQMTEGLLELLSPFALAGGVAATVLFVLHGALFLSLKLGGGLEERAIAIARRLGPVVLTVWTGMVLWSRQVATVGTLGTLVGVIAGLALVAMAASIVFVRRGRLGMAFVGTGLAIVSLTAASFASLFPNVMVSTLNPAWSLTIYSASASAYSLKLMTFVAGGLVPIVIVYQSWTYWVFRQRITPSSELEY